MRRRTDGAWAGLVAALMGAAIILAVALATTAHARPVRWEAGVASVFHDSVLACGSGSYARRPHRYIVASREYPCGTKLRICYRHRCGSAFVWDSGPYVAGRVLDLDTLFAQRIGFPYGVARVLYRRAA